MGHLLDAPLQLLERQRLIYQPPVSRGAPIDVLAHECVIHSAPKGQQFARDFRRAAARQDAPVDLGKAELCFIGGECQVAREQRTVASAEAPPVDHGDRRLLIPAQTTPPTVGFSLGRAHGTETLRFRLAKVFLEIHARRPGIAFAG